MVNKLSSELMPGKHPNAGTYADGGFHASGAVLRPWSTTQRADQPSGCLQTNKRQKPVGLSNAAPRDHGRDQLSHDLATGGTSWQDLADKYGDGVSDHRHFSVQPGRD